MWVWGLTRSDVTSVKSNGNSKPQTTPVTPRWRWRVCLHRHVRGLLIFSPSLCHPQWNAPCFWLCVLNPQFKGRTSKEVFKEVCPSKQSIWLFLWHRHVPKAFMLENSKIHESTKGKDKLRLSLITHLPVQLFRKLCWFDLMVKWKVTFL